jgi:hypothetical protein
MGYSFDDSFWVFLFYVQSRDRLEMFKNSSTISSRRMD